MPTIREVKTELRHREWAEQIQECQSSGMTVTAWCKEKGISQHTYYSRLNVVRKELLKRGAGTVQTACWFMMKKELQTDRDVILRDEDAYIELVQNGEFDIIFADECMERMTPGFEGIFVNTRHFAVSGKLIEK